MNRPLTIERACDFCAARRQGSFPLDKTLELPLVAATHPAALPSSRKSHR
jgi:hypothetical protein